MKLELLADNPSACKRVAKWYFDQWLSDVPEISLSKVENKLAKSINRESAPLIVLAKISDDIVGAAEFKIREMEIYPEYEFWLGGVYVDIAHRGKGIASRMVQDVLKRAQKAGAGKLYLQTEDLTGGLYTACGFKPLQEVDYKGHHVLVMVVDLDEY